MKLEVRENRYVRNCYGRIAKIEYIEGDAAYCDNWRYQSYEDHITFINLDDEDDIDEILKTSYNITDILEIGDYVNGHEVKDIDYAFEDIALNVKNPRIVPYIDNIKNEYIDNIKSVITHEQMEQMAYKVGE